MAGVIYDERHPGSVVTWWDGLPREVYRYGATMVMRAIYRAASSGPHVIGAAGVGAIAHRCRRRQGGGGQLTSAGRVRGGALPARQKSGCLSTCGPARRWRCGWSTSPPAAAAPCSSRCALGSHRSRTRTTCSLEAAEAARTADVAVVVVGSADATESEGYDRDTLALPGRQDELVAAVAAVNPDTVVVVNSGMPVRMPWVDDVAAVVYAWLPGQAGGDALADVLLGSTEPGGRLPVTLPRTDADAPVLHALPKGSELPYSEGLLVGYRGYDRAGREPLFCFGHGLGYTDWEYESAQAASARPGGWPGSRADRQGPQQRRTGWPRDRAGLPRRTRRRSGQAGPRARGVRACRRRRRAKCRCAPERSRACVRPLRRGRPPMGVAGGRLHPPCRPVLARPAPARARHGAIGG